MGTIRISSDFDSGNIIYKNQDGNIVNLEIRKDINSDFFQWFYFRADDLQVGQSYTFRILNAGNSSYPEGWKIQNIPHSFDGKNWSRLKSHFEDGVLSFDCQADGPKAEFAYFVPYLLSRHEGMIERAKESPYFLREIVGKSVEERKIELLQYGDGAEGKRKTWILARQHPGETMAEWFMEGLIDRLGQNDAAITELLSWTDLYLIPNINPDGSYLGNLRTNAPGANLNREWDKARQDYSPEVLFALNQMDQHGVDICLDIHGDEDIPYVFGSGAEGNPGFTPRLQEIDDTFRQNWQRITPAFQLEHGYDRDEPGTADLSLCTNQVSERYGAFALTIEMPFTDNFLAKDELHGWSPEKSKQLGKSAIEAINSIKNFY